MKLFFKNVLQFLVLTIVVYVVAINLWDQIIPAPFKPNILYKVGDGLVSIKLEESKDLEQLDILFLGSSHAYTTFDTRFYDNEGLQSFNWGTTKQTHVQTQMLIKYYLETCRPKLVVYEIFPEIFTLDGSESTIDFINAGKPFSQNLFSNFLGENGIKVLNTFIVKETKEKLLAMGPEVADKRQEIYKNFNYIEGGYIENQLKNDKDVSDIYIQWNPREEQMVAFQENLKLLRENNIPYILVVAPYSFKYENQDEIDDFFKKKAGEVYDYNKILKFSSANDFMDFHHLNKFGAQKLNKHLITILKEEYSNILF